MVVALEALVEADNLKRVGIGKRVDQLRSDRLIEANEQGAVSNGVHILAGHGPSFDSGGEFEPGLQEQFVEDIFRTACRVDMVDVQFKLPGKVLRFFCVSIPDAEIGAG